MYAIVQVGGRQYRAVAGERLVVDRMDVEPGARVQLADVRMLIAEDGDGTQTEIGRPRVEDVAVAARAISHFRGPKILVFKYKPKKRYRRHQGFRAELTELRIEEVRRGAFLAEPTPATGRKRAPAQSLAAEPAAVDEAAEAPATPAKRSRPSAKAATPALAPTGPKVTPKAPPAESRSRKPARATESAPSEKKTPPTRTRAAKKQEQPDGS
ncbi:MAG TPA: 50S ribosomal protein L21 [Candidatus Dormibacteraeota bacterium]|nr:50S ribosomal protein L21 [Candidatus Dormibacteraeota bacterium]